MIKLACGGSRVLSILLKVVILIGIFALGGCLLLGMPGKSFKGQLEPFTPDENLLAWRLKAHVVMLAETIGERNTKRYSQLQRSAGYIADSFRNFGYAPSEEVYTADGKQVKNIVAELKGTTWPEEIVIIGAHYDSALGTPGANDNASGVAAMLELARQFKDAKPARTLRFVAFVNEEPPWFQTELMGSRVHAAGARKRGEKVVSMLALETIGCYLDFKGSQQYPPPVSLFYPDTGDFIAFVGNLGSRRRLCSTVETFRKTTMFPSEGIAAPEFVKGIGWSDHWAFWQEGYTGVMVTDTAPFRYGHYHEPSDTPDKLDYQRMARVVAGINMVVDEQVR